MKDSLPRDLALFTLLFLLQVGGVIVWSLFIWNVLSDAIRFGGL